MALVFRGSSKRSRGFSTIRDQWEDQKKKPSTLRKSENEGIQRFPATRMAGSSLILLIDGEVSALNLRAFGRAIRDRYPDSGFHLAPAFPVFQTSGLWEFVTRYSGATVPDFHGIP